MCEALFLPRLLCQAIIIRGFSTSFILHHDNTITPAQTALYLLHFILPPPWTASFSGKENAHRYIVRKVNMARQIQGPKTTVLRRPIRPPIAVAQKRLGFET